MKPLRNDSAPGIIQTQISNQNRMLRARIRSYGRNIGSTARGSPNVRIEFFWVLDWGFGGVHQQDGEAVICRSGQPNTWQWTAQLSISQDLSEFESELQGCRGQMDSPKALSWTTASLNDISSAPLACSEFWLFYRVCPSQGFYSPERCGDFLRIWGFDIENREDFGEFQWSPFHRQ